MSKIMETVKKMVDVSPTNDAFDEQIKVHINTAFDILLQLGVGDESDPFIIETGNETWEDFEYADQYPIIKTYIPLKVKTLFDPPTGGVLDGAIDRSLKELEWRIIVDTKK